MTIDIADLDIRAAADEGTEVELLHPITREKLGIVFHILGSDSFAYRDKRTELARRRVQKYDNGRGPNINVDEIEDNACELLAACTTGWSSFPENGKEITFSEKEAYRIYRQYPWIKEQIDAAVSDRAIFLKKQ